MTLDQERIRRVRDDGNHGVIVVLYLDIDDDEYVAAGEPGDLVVTASSALSKILLRMLLEAKAAGDVEELRDDAARAVMALAQSGTDRQAFMAPLMEALFEGKVYSRDVDPMAGYVERAAAAEQAARERRETADK